MSYNAKKWGCGCCLMIGKMLLGEIENYYKNAPCFQPYLSHFMISNLLNVGEVVSHTCSFRCFLCFWSDEQVRIDLGLVEG